MQARFEKLMHRQLLHVSDLLYQCNNDFSINLIDKASWQNDQRVTKLPVFGTARIGNDTEPIDGVDRCSFYVCTVTSRTAISWLQCKKFTLLGYFVTEVVTFPYFDKQPSKRNPDMALWRPYFVYLSDQCIIFLLTGAPWWGI